jgi:hypothetical protein
MGLRITKSQYCSCNIFSSANLKILFILKNVPKLGYGPYNLTNKGLWMENLPVVNSNFIAALFTSAGMKYPKSPFMPEEDQLLALLCTYRIDSNTRAGWLSERRRYGLRHCSQMKWYRNSLGLRSQRVFSEYPDLIHTSRSRTCHLDIWFDSSWYDLTRQYVQRARLCVIRALAHTLVSFSISETCIKEPWE